MRPGSINVESDEEIISRPIEEQFKLIENNLNQQIEIRQAHLNEVDIDAHDFNLDYNQNTNSANTEPINSQSFEVSDEPIAKENIEKETKLDDDDFQNYESNDAVKEDYSYTDTLISKNEDKSNKSLPEETDIASKTKENNHPEQNLSLNETISVEENYETNSTSAQGDNIVFEENDQTSLESGKNKALKPKD